VAIQKRSAIQLIEFLGFGFLRRPTTCVRAGIGFGFLRRPTTCIHAGIGFGFLRRPTTCIHAGIRYTEPAPRVKRVPWVRNDISLPIFRGTHVETTSDKLHAHWGIL